MTRRAFERWLQFLEDEQRGMRLPEGPRPVSPSLRSRRRAALVRRSKPSERWLSAEELREQIGTTFYAGAVSPPESFAIHPGKLVAGHVAAARRVEVDLYEYSPVMEVRPGKIVQLVTPTGTVRAKHAVIATNAYTPRLGLFRVDGVSGAPLHLRHPQSSARRSFEAITWITGACATRSASFRSPPA